MSNLGRSRSGRQLKGNKSWWAPNGVADRTDTRSLFPFRTDACETNSFVIVECYVGCANARPRYTCGDPTYDSNRITAPSGPALSGLPAAVIAAVIAIADMVAITVATATHRTNSESAVAMGIVAFVVIRANKSSHPR